MIGDKLYWAFQAGDVGAGIPTGRRLRTKHCLDISVQKLRKRILFRMSIFL